MYFLYLHVFCFLLFSWFSLFFVVCFLFFFGLYCCLWCILCSIYYMLLGCMLLQRACCTICYSWYHCSWSTLLFSIHYSPYQGAYTMPALYYSPAHTLFSRRILPQGQTLYPTPLYTTQYYTPKQTL